MQRYRYESFGQVTASDPDFANPYTYTGREWDPETGLFYYRARYYDAMEGRFISKDPIGFAGGDVNVYRYVHDNPINYFDPSGLIVTGFTGGGSVGIWGVAEASGGVIGDLHGNAALMGNINGSVGLQASASTGPSYVFSFADNVCDLKGPSFDLHLRLIATATISLPMDLNIRNIVFTIGSPGLELGVGVGVGNTWVTDPVNVIKNKGNVVRDNPYSVGAALSRMNSN